MEPERIEVTIDGRRLEVVPVDRQVKRWLIAAGLALGAIALLVWLP